MVKTLMDEIIQTEEDKLCLAQEEAILDITETVCKAMKDKEVNKEQLAHRLATSVLNCSKRKARKLVAKFFEGDISDIRILVDVLWVLGFLVSFNVKQK